MKLEWSAEDEAFRAELIQFLEANAPPEIKAGHDFMDSGVDEAGGHEVIPEWGRDWQATLFDNGWMIPAYPPELGGRNCTSVQTLVYLETMAARRVPRSGHFPGYAIVAPSLAPGMTPRRSTRKMAQSMWPRAACTTVPGTATVAITISDVPSARFSGIPSTVTRGTKTIPPPTPRKPETNPVMRPTVA